MIYIYGKSNSGKSKYAENMLCDIARSKGLNKYYFATMIPSNKENELRIAKHREQRKDLGFVTIEEYRNIDKIKEFDENSIVLLECMANYVANNKFEVSDIKNDKNLEEKLYLEILDLDKRVAKLVIVGNDIYNNEDEESFDKETLDYIKLMKSLHKKLIEYSESFIELINGEIVIHK